MKKIRWISTLDYFNYDKVEAKEFIKSELDWRDYGGKHHESNYTKIYQAYILPTKFGYDKRKAHLSSLIIAGQITREEALKELQVPLYEKKSLQDDIEHLINKFEIDKEEFQRIMQLENKKFQDYPSYSKLWFYPKEGSFVYELLKRAYKKLIRRE